MAREEAGDRADWDMLNANLARLVDVMEYWLGVEYARWTTDPADARRARVRAQRDGRLPPPSPLIPPVATRPESVHDALASSYEIESGRYRQ